MLSLRTNVKQSKKDVFTDINFATKKESIKISTPFCLSIFRNYKAAFAVSTTTVNASGSLTAKSANIFLLTKISAFLQAFTNLE